MAQCVNGIQFKRADGNILHRALIKPFKIAIQNMGSIEMTDEAISKLTGSEKVILMGWKGATTACLGRFAETRTPACAPIKSTSPTRAVKRTRTPTAAVSSVNGVFSWKEIRLIGYGNRLYRLSYDHRRNLIVERNRFNAAFHQHPGILFERGGFGPFHGHGNCEAICRAAGNHKATDEELILLQESHRNKRIRSLTPILR